MRNSRLCLCLLLLSACASHSPIVPNGRGGFFVSKQASTGFPVIGVIEAELLTEAQQHCVNQGKTMQVDQVDKTKPPYLLGNYPRVEMHFSCR